MELKLKNKISREDLNLDKKLPIKIVQFGGGNFLRAFSDYVVDKLNIEADFNAGIAHVKVTPSKGNFDVFEAQENLYTLFIRGVKKSKTIDEKRIISAIQKSINPYENYTDYLNLAKEEQLQFIFSNTTESGIVFDELENKISSVPHKNFPAKLTSLLYERFKFFHGAEDKGLTIIPSELINDNATTLKSYILKYAELWNLDKHFTDWVEHCNSFHNTLVDRIVPGYPKDGTEFYLEQLDYEDGLIVVSEAFLLWVIEGNQELLKKIPFDKANENILIVNDLNPYRTSKVRILNGAHTAMVAFSILCGKETVKEAIDDEFTAKLINEAVFKEIIPVLDMPEDELKVYAEDVFDRFRNPFLKHFLSSIALNSISKFKVRVLPTLVEYTKKKNQLPKNIVFALASLIRFYKCEWQNKTLPVLDDESIIEEFKSIWNSYDYNQIAQLSLENKSFWDVDLTEIPELRNEVAKALELIDSLGIKEAYTQFIN
ncbi:tagaturonate reductase [Moheibacter sediminis]|uniref:Tagaturonate reductase n=1 Tax=Moheibacter sediminis TaxID=1434700 RepID=A0A1W2CZ43_9FLAO|nr:tagaturonate reductase [Moheibacter sediminis]